jgi:hypothetical protein
MGRSKSKRTNGTDNNGQLKRPKPETGESYAVKKYRAEKTYNAMEQFVKYTKAHRMLDASYVRWNTGTSQEKPFVFSTRVGGVDLGWGRGKTREAAMDCACRASFALFNAHGYKNFTLDEDCLLEAPTYMPVMPPPPPPPLPPLPGGPPPPPPLGLPPLPSNDLHSVSAAGGVGVGVGAGMHTQTNYSNTIPQDYSLIPQPLVQSQAPVATSMNANANANATSNATSHTASTSSTTTSAADDDDAPNNAANPTNSTAAIFSLDLSSASGGQVTSTNTSTNNKLKGGLKLVYDPGSSMDMCMEERRASSIRYKKMVALSTSQ